MYKPSHYNIVFQDSEKILVFNRKTKKYIKAKAVKDRVVDIIYNNNLSPSDNKILKKLVDSGILVDSHTEELEDLELIRNDYINNSHSSNRKMQLSLRLLLRKL